MALSNRGRVLLNTYKKQALIALSEINSPTSCRLPENALRGLRLRLQARSLHLIDAERQPLSVRWKEVSAQRLEAFTESGLLS